MIWVGLLNLMYRCMNELKEEITLQEIHEKTGIHRKILSRTVNRPEYPCSSEHIGKLATFFFNKLKVQAKTPRAEYNLMRDIAFELVQVFPEDDSYWAGMEFFRNPYRPLEPVGLWLNYIAKNAPGEAEAVKKEMQSRNYLPTLKDKARSKMKAAVKKARKS